MNIGDNIASDYSVRTDFIPFAAKNITINRYDERYHIVIYFYDADFTCLVSSFLINKNQYFSTYPQTLNVPPPTAFLKVCISNVDGTVIDLDSITGKEFKLESGSFATDWSPAIKDVQAEIDAAVSGLETYINGSFKDGIITETEAQAIEKYNNSVNASKFQIQSAYTQLYANAYLEGTAKTNLSAAKTALDTAITNLLASISAAIADGQTTPTEKADVDAKFAFYNTALSTYQIRVEEANKAIQDKLNTLSTDKVNAIQVAKRNLIFKPTRWQYLAGFVANGYKIIETHLNEYNNCASNKFKLTPNEPHILAFKCLQKSGNFLYEIYCPGSTNIAGAIVLGSNSILFTPTAEQAAGETELRFYGTHPTLSVLCELENIHLRQGNKEMDWSPAIEDVQTEIETAQATADIAAAKTEGFTEIEGGLVTTNIIKLMDALAAAETAGINGMKGNGSNPAFWAGGTYAQALQMIAAIVLKHNGAGKIGDLIIEENGTVVVKEPATGQIRVVWNATELPLLADLLSQSQISDSEINSAANRTTPGTTTLANALVVTKANSKLTFDSDITGTVNAPSAGTALITIEVNLYKDGVLYTPISSFSYRLEQPGYPSASFNESIDFVLNSVPVGVYSVGLTIGATSDGSSDWAVSATLGASTLAFLFEQDIQQVRYGLDGWMAFYSASKYFYLTSKSGVPFLKIRGDVDIPGLRCAATVFSDGTSSKKYGISIGSSLSSTGVYIITHNIGNTDYSVNLTMINASARINGVVTTKDANSFAVRVVNVYTDTLTNSAFEFTLYANG